MENRFERLYGYAQRSLVKNIRKELGNDESLTMGILIFHSYSESFYYESTVKNTLLLPELINEDFTEKEIWNYEMIWYLAKYMSHPRTKTHIRDLISENDMLAKKDASFFAILLTQEDYDQFKISWIEWVEKELNFPLDETYNETYKPILTKLFYFANYLLTIVKCNAYTTYFTPEEGTFKERMYRIVIGDIKNNNTGKTDRFTGELLPKNNYKWNRKLDSQISYSELALILEICFKQPFAVSDKINDIKSIINGNINNPQKDLVFCSMAKPLQYNGEFQGIIYVTKNREKGTFSKKDSIKFKNAIQEFHIQSIIYASRFDTARFHLDNILETDINVHPLIKVLNCQHLYSTCSLGIIFIPDTGCFIRYREGEFMQTRKLYITLGKFLKFINGILNLDLNELDENNNYYWLDINSALENKFGRQLNNLLGISENLFINSITGMKFIERQNSCHYFLFSSNHINDSSYSVKQSFALRTHSNISKLIDTVTSAKKMFDIKNNIINEFQLSFFHDEKNYLNTLNNNLKTAIIESYKKKIIKNVNVIIDEITYKVDRYKDYVQLLREDVDSSQKMRLRKKDIDKIVSSIKSEISQSDIKIVPLFYIDEKDEIETYPSSLEYIIRELVRNAAKQYSLYSLKTAKNKEIQIQIDKLSGKYGHVDAFSFRVFSTETEIPESIIQLAGEESISHGSNISHGSSGLGFITIKNKLKRMNAARFGVKYFEIKNETKIKGVSVRFSLPNKIIK